MQALGLSICVVLYESVETTRRFHAALLASLAQCSEFELLYYDNSPGTALADDFKSDNTSALHYWHDPRNLGFAYANNQLILRSRHDRVLLLNPDVFGFDSAFWTRLAAMPVEGDARFVRLLNADGSFQDCVGEPARLSRVWQRRPAYAAMTTPTVVGTGIMAFMLTDKSVFARVGLLDASYPLYAEDMDWCHRANLAGFKIVFDPRFVLTHLGGASAADRWSRAASLKRKYLAERVFIDKHFRGLHWAAMRALNRLKILLRARA
jgi:GT2 family glycosyltransferase